MTFPGRFADQLVADQLHTVSLSFLVDQLDVRRGGVAPNFSQQIARMDGEGIRTLMEGAAYLFSNEYEKGLIESKTGWTADEILAKVGTRVTTLGSNGVRIERVGEPVIEVGVPEEKAK